MKTLIILIATINVAAAQWGQPQSPAVPRKHLSRDFRRDSSCRQARTTAPGIELAGSELNALAAVAVPVQHAKFALVFHGPAVDGILDETHYKTKFGTSNPNLKVIAEMKKKGVEFFVCGQYLASEKIDPKTLTPDVALAADALLVLMQYQNMGYALMSF